jgi:bifunctional NMN adenylyltransferase/nudix hydrolase
MTKAYDTLVFCGRFQPFHNGHKAVIDKALEYAKEVVIVIGSAFQPRSPKNPLTFGEREQLIKAEYPDRNVKIVGVMDYPYDDNAWVSSVQKSVDNVKTGRKTGLIGHSKDNSSYYLKIFPDWRKHVEVANVGGINATDIRRAIYEGSAKPVYDLMPKKSLKVLEDIWIKQGDMFDLETEYHEIIEDRDRWKDAPYAPTFVTTDAVLTQSGSILLIKRDNFPFKNCWALPGGYLEMGISIEDNMIKELDEETCVKVPAKVLRGSIKDRAVFDHPERDPRGRTITHAFYIDLGFPDEKLPKVKGGDDAALAEWVLLSEVTSDKMAFDHYHIIRRFISTY